MFKNCSTCPARLSVAGFSLLEVQLYLVLVVMLACMVCQVACVYHTLFDTITARAQNCCQMLAAIFQVNASFDDALMNPTKDGTPSVGAFFKKNKLISCKGSRHQLLLADVTHFEGALDSTGAVVRGATFSCEYKGKRVQWYRASRTRA